MTGLEALKKYGSPFDEPLTSVNERTEFERKNMVLWDIPQEYNNAMPALPNKLYCNKDLVQPLTMAFINLIKGKLTKELKTWEWSEKCSSMIQILCTSDFASPTG